MLTILVGGVLFSAVSSGLFYWLATRTSSTEQFLQWYWSVPLAPQGSVPEDFSPLEASLSPKACGTCHKEQFTDWRQSLHAEAMSVGIWWQLPILGQQAGNRCLRCHAPLAEQKALTAAALEWDNKPSTPAPNHISSDLHRQGLVCAVCHIRSHQRFGPPAESQPSAADATAHNGFKAHAAFEDSRFCAVCHQFPADGPRVNGKLRENTYQQWRASPAAAAGEHCQSCHMPGRRHLWRGIHDSAMVRRGLAVSTEIKARDTGAAVLIVTLENVGAGHHLPTYLVPKLVVRVIGATQNTQNAPGTVIDQATVGWFVETDLRSERFDTRIPAGHTHRLRFPLNPELLSEHRHLTVQLEVKPREHYERMYQEVLADPNLTAAQRLQVRQALQEAQAMHYVLLNRKVFIED